MPSTITHAIFSMEVEKKLNSQYKFYNNEYIKVFAQGPDPLNFYNLDIPLSNSNIRKTYPKLLHNSSTKKIFLTIIKYIKENKLSYDKYIMSYLYGIMCHYFLDTNTHPYIIFHSGHFKNNEKSTYKYNGLHSEMEVNIDLYMIKNKLKLNPNTFKIHKYCLNIDKFNINLCNMLNYCYKQVYELDNFAKIYYKSIKDMKRVNYIFRYDRFGLKKKLYKFIDKLTPKSFSKIDPLSYYDKIDTKYLNLEKNIWYHITNDKEIYNDSFIDLYNSAINECCKAITIVNDVIYNNKNEKELNKVFLNKSYVTGKNCNCKKEISFFKF